MARRRSKWRRTTQIMRKMMQEARKVRVRESLRQCPVCGSPHSLSIEIKENKWTGIKTAHVVCSACGFEVTLENLPPIADEFWVYSRILDQVQGVGRAPAAEATATAASESAESAEAETVPSEESGSAESAAESEGLEIEFHEVREE